MLVVVVVTEVVEVTVGQASKANMLLPVSQ